MSQRNVSIFCYVSHVFLSFISEQYIGLGRNLSSMKIILSLIICSQIAGTCMPPYQWPETFNTQYDCMIFGYEESLKKMQEIGRQEVNQHNIYIRFTCTPEQII